MLLWEKGLLGYSTLKILQRTVLFYVGLNFVLWGGQEHYDLLVSQFSCVPPERSVYNKDVCYEQTMCEPRRGPVRIRKKLLRLQVSRQFTGKSEGKSIERYITKTFPERSSLPCNKYVVYFYQVTYFMIAMLYLSVRFLHNIILKIFVAQDAYIFCPQKMADGVF